MASVNDLTVVITVNKKDLWFCRMCVASIRYYYPTIPILLIKDELNGGFSTIELEKKWNVGLLDFAIKKFGWSAAKIFLYTDSRFYGKYLFVIDSDIIFIGKVLDQFLDQMQEYDVFVSSELEVNPYASWVKDVYFDVKSIETKDSRYAYPGYFFNAGQLLVKGGFVRKEGVTDYFDFKNYPYWKNLIELPLVDQSLFNFLFPIMEKENQIKVNANFSFMLWSKDEKCKDITVDNIISDFNYQYLIHWAGDIRTPYIAKMKNAELLKFFENYYYTKIKFGGLIRSIRLINSFLIFWFLNLKKSIKYHLIRSKISNHLTIETY